MSNEFGITLHIYLTHVFFAVMIFSAIFFLKGKGGRFLINKYSILNEDKKAKYDEKAISCFFGWALIVVFFCNLALIFAAVRFGIPRYICFMGQTVIYFVGIVGALIYVNTGNRFRKAA